MSAAGDRLRRALDAPPATALLTLLAFSPFLALRIVRSDFDPSRLVCAGANYCDPEATPAGLFVGPGSDGYDGQFFYRLALDPFTRSRVDHGIRLDKPAYRQSRIVYPLVVWGVTLGRADWAPWGLIAVNVVGWVVLGGLAGALAQCIGRHAAWGLLLSLYPGFLLTLARDTGEIVSSALLVGALLAVQRDRIAAASVVLAIAALARETTLGFAAALLAVLAWRAVHRQARWRDAAMAVAPFAAYAGQQCLILANWGMLALQESGDNVGRPFDGLLLFLQRAFIPFRGEARLMAAQVMMLAWIGLLASLRAGRETPHPAIRTAWWLYAGLVLCFSSAIWSEDWAYLRAACEFYLLGAAILVASPTPVRGSAVAVVAGVFAWTAQFHRGG